MYERTVHLLHGAFFAVTTGMTDFFSGNGAILLLDTKMEAEGAHEHLGSIRQGQIQRVLPGGRAAAGRGGRAGRGAWLQKSGYWPPAAGNAPDRPRPGGEVPGREKYLGAGRPASAGGRPGGAGAASGPQSAGAGPQTRHGLRAHRGTECSSGESGTGAPALRHVGGYRLRGRGAAGFHGGPACGGGAGMPPAVRPVHPASAASRGFGHAAGQPRQR